MPTEVGLVDDTRASYSLTSALRRVFQQHDRVIDLDELHAVMGLGLLVCVPVDETDERSGSVFARDAFLVETARCYGATVRPIHPPSAARGLTGRDEFRQHFDASYAPLVRRALEHGQSVLSWGGWTDPYDCDWGLMTEPGPGGVGWCGEVSESPGSDAPMPVVIGSPPTQVYVVETVRRQQPGSTELIRLLVNHTESALRGRIDEAFGVVTGARAVRTWMQRCGARADQRGSAFFQTIATHARSLQRTLKRVAPETDGPVAAIREACDALSGILAEGAAPDDRVGAPVAEVFEKLADRL